ncbi:type II toxin-antitoxin system RelE/ParE family toxin [Micromonospora sp. NPDC005305]|uniref:type II toxin-antitoxin system RelE/ParE family toxin n=1 Tax=Micromonospora sp. NPDC005305 TaxID=3156875 RepID=UPI0033A6CF0C
MLTRDAGRSVRVTGEVRQWLRDLRRNDPALRPRSGRDVAIRVLFVFDPWSQAVLLIAGNKAGNWSRWYQQNIPMAEVAYKAWLDNERERRGES